MVLINKYEFLNFNFCHGKSLPWQNFHGKILPWQNFHGKILPWQNFHGKKLPWHISHLVKLTLRKLISVRDTKSAVIWLRPGLAFMRHHIFFLQ